VITTVAPAKINWTLEVLGRRDDGYHEVRTVLQAIDLHDEISFKPSSDGPLSVRDSFVPEGPDLIARAANAFHSRHRQGGTLRAKKSVPVGAGLGGGSSDAAATLRLLNASAGSPLDDGTLWELASGIGSDVPFFLRGGVALAEGRGDHVTPLPDLPPTWLVLVVPPITVLDKTRELYAALTEADFSDGLKSGALADHIRQGVPPGDNHLLNAFERAAFERFQGLDKYRDWLLSAGAERVYLSGAGPALFALTSGEPEARVIRARMNRPKMGERVHVVRTVTAAESTLTWDS
jgi:4-diphosphocytidyl-2-C-methyl-D-erythritol kinase